MNSAALIKSLGDLLGQNNVIVRNEFHVQVKVKGGGYHDVWFSLRQGLKWRLHGTHATRWGSPDSLLRQLGAHDEQKTDLSNMSAALELCNAVNAAQRVAVEQGVSRAIFCDAGYKHGRARIGIVIIDGDNIDAIRRTVKVYSNSQAEDLAVEEAMSIAKQRDLACPIYTDNKTTAATYGVEWISRDRNKPADRMANMRGK